MSTPNEISSEVWRSMRREWLWVYHCEPPRSEVWSPPSPAPNCVFFIEQGEARIRAAGTEQVVPPGRAFFSAPGIRQHWFEPHTRLLSVGYRCEWPDGTLLHRSGLNLVAKSDGLHEATMVLRKQIHGTKKSVTYLEDVKPHPQSPAAWANREAAFNAWFVIFLETLRHLGITSELRASANQRRIEQLLTMLNGLPLNQTQVSIPKSFPLGQRRAEQLLQEHGGLSIRAFIERRRINAAREKLLSEHSSLKEIAFTLGFRHASHFTAWFKRHTGMPPSAYRVGGGDEMA